MRLAARYETQSFLRQRFFQGSMQGVIVNFRRGRRTVHHYQMIVQPEGCSKKEDADKLVGKNVVWKSSAGKEIPGTVLAPHGKAGRVRARFESGMPGQAIGTKVTIR